MVDKGERITIKGKPYELKRKLTYGEVFDYQELRNKINENKFEIQKETSKGKEDEVSERLMELTLLGDQLDSQSFKMMGDTLMDCLGWDKTQLRKTEIEDIIEAYEQIVEKSTKLPKKLEKPSIKPTHSEI